MPEGDTIFRAARNLHLALAGREVVRMEVPRAVGRVPAPGVRVDRVDAVGKHCLIHFDDGSALRTHMRMTGSWHLYRPGERWRKSPAAARAVIEVAPAPDRPDDRGWVAVCFAAPVVELLEPAAAARGEGTAHLGPDLCRPDADLDDAVARMGRLLDPATDVATALLDQRVAAGIGNVYKCEALFACGVHPATPVADVALEDRRRLLTTAARQLRANLATHDRTTVAGGGVAVYGRGGRPCRRCGAAIASRMLGDPVRITYWCPTCQPAPAAAAGRGGPEVGAPGR